MKLKQRFAILVVFIIVLFTTKSHWIPHLPPSWTQQDDSADRKNNPKILHSDSNELVQIQHIPDKDSIEADSENSETDGVELVKTGIDVANPEITMTIEDCWKLAHDWLSPREIYPDDSYFDENDNFVSRKSNDISQILHHMATAEIVAADVLPKGTQLKLILELKGGQKVVFKPQRYERDYIVQGESWDGFDRHNAEVAAFHLDHLLNFRRAPFVVGRKLHMRNEILPVAGEQLRATFRKIRNETDDLGKPKLCFFGKCYYCKEQDLACPQGKDSGLLEGSLNLWMGKAGYGFGKLRHPYQRTYKKNKKATWEVNEDYCNHHVKVKEPYNKGPRLLDVTDGSVFDYLIMNGDRHHYEIFQAFGDEAMMIMMDNAKSYGNPELFDKSILAPMKQCCILRKNTFEAIKNFRGRLGKVLDESMKTDPIYPIVTQSHLDAMDKRLEHVIETVNTCIEKYGREHVLLDNWTGSRPAHH